METYLAYLDQFRYMAGSLGMCVLLCRAALSRRDPFRLRIVGASLVCFALAFAYVPLRGALDSVYRHFPLVIGPYWLGMSFVLVWFVRFCYETGPAGALFRAMMAAFAENFVTVLVRNLLVYTLFPTFPERHPAAYTLGLAAIYAGFFFTAIRVLEPRIRADELGRQHGGRADAGIYLFIYLSFTVLLAVSKYVMEIVIPPLAADPALALIHRTLQFYLAGVMLLLSVMMSMVMLYLYKRLERQTEREILLRLARDRQSQYEFSKENIEMINRKTHDLKHQLQALAMVSDGERTRQLREASRAVDFYDAVVKTGNEALDILLTEKSVYCTNRQIRLSCMVNTRQLEKIRLVDLYTVLGNALENAIESVERIADPDRKVISLSILDRGNMLYIQLENYYEGTLDLKEGLPVTRKAQKQDHGYGLKSIASICRAYGGRMDIRTEDQVFYLEMIFP